MHTKTDSEVTTTSVATSTSPTRSPPRRPLYYVQSPSHDGEKTVTTSFHSTPVASPHHSSSSTHFSASKKDQQHQHSVNPWKHIDVIEEEGFLEKERNGGYSRRCYFLAFVVGFFVLFSLFSLILWGASRPMKPKIVIKVCVLIDFSVLEFDLNWVFIDFVILGFDLNWVVIKFAFLG